MWLEKQGYDVSYTDDVHAPRTRRSCSSTTPSSISGHSEYWSLQQFNGFKAAREAGVNIASFSANTAYWKVRYEDGGRTLVCYKTVEGGGSAGSGSVSDNDWGPDGIKGTADDALGARRHRRHRRRQPAERDHDLPRQRRAPGDPSAPPGGRVGPDMPENQLFGHHVRRRQRRARASRSRVPAGNANEEFAADRIWRNTGISENVDDRHRRRLVDWEWDAIPTQAQYLAHQPAGVKRVYSTNVQTASDNSWLQDEGRLRNTSPPPGQPGTVGAVKYTAPSGAQVFAGGTMQWSRGLSSEADARIQQATYNIFSDMGVAAEHARRASPSTRAAPTRRPTAPSRSRQNPAKTATDDHLQRLGLQRPRRHDRQIRMGPRRRRQLRDQQRHQSQHHPQLRGRGHLQRAPAGHRQRRRHRPRRAHDHDHQQPAADRELHGDPERDQKRRTDQPSPAPPPPIPTGRSPNTNGTSTATAPTRPTAAPTPAISHTYATPGTYTVGLRVTDNGGKTATTTRPVSINSGEVSKYSDSVLATPGLVHYWRMGETSRPDLRRQQRLQPGHGQRRHRSSACPAASPKTPTARPSSTASTTPPAPPSTSPAPTR